MKNLSASELVGFIREDMLRNKRFHYHSFWHEEINAPGAIRFSQFLIDQAKKACEGKSAPAVCVDIGTDNGLSAFSVALSVPQLRVHTYDIRPEPLAALPILAAQLGANNLVLHLSSFSPETLPFDAKIAFAFIDGGHSYDDCKKDMLNVAAASGPGTVFACHDYYEECEVWQAVTDFRKLSEGNWHFHHDTVNRIAIFNRD